MKYKVGDRVRIKSLDWYNENKDEYGNIDINCYFIFYADRSKYCGKVFTIDVVFANCYTVKEDNHEYYWTDEMIEGLVEESVNIDVAVEETTKDISDKVVDTIMGGLMVGKSFNLPQGYIFKDENGNVINATKIVLEKKKKEYPKTYEECEKILGLEDSIIEGCLGYEYKLLNAFQKLLMCRNAYWLIAGQELMLGKPWEPNWTSFEGYPAIYMYRYQITLSVARDVHHRLAFPTEEMRNAFYENFKELIEQCYDTNNNFNNCSNRNLLGV